MKKVTRRSTIPMVAENPPNSMGSFSTRFSMPSFIKRVEKLTNDQRVAIKKMGFGNLLLLPNQTLSKNLLVELMERWNCERRVFMLLPGEITMSLMDIALILGIRVIGDPVILKEDEPISDLEMEYGAVKRKITTASLENRLDSLGDLVNDDFIRTFLLFTFGTFLFPNSNGKVDSRYLHFLKNLEDVCKFAWGAAVLEDLSMWLSKRKESNVQYVGGCLIFLQIWCHEHVDVARPSLLDCYLTFPRACRWGNSKSHQRQYFCTKFKEMQDHQIIWTLQPSPVELEVNIVVEILEAQNEVLELPRPQNSSGSVSVVNEDNLGTTSLISDQIIGVQNDSDTNITWKIPRAPDVDMDELKVSRDVPKVTTDTTEYPSTSSNTMEMQKENIELAPISEDGDEDDSRTRDKSFKGKIIELEKEIDKLRSENKMLKDELLSSQLLEEQNSELKKEVDNLTREKEMLSLSSNNLVFQLEKILLEDDLNAVDK